jgi:ABC-type antimicrobial peptide transport system permease subunit
MNGVLKTILIIMLALGMMGIILGISVGLYRNDQLAKLQTSMGSADIENEGLSEYSDQDNGNSGNSSVDFLLNSNLHTILLAVGTILTIISVMIFLINMRKLVG